LSIGPLCSYEARIKELVENLPDCRLVALFAEKSLQAIFEVLQHYRSKSGKHLLALSFSGFDP
jgi:hypothetical protein